MHLEPTFSICTKIFIKSLPNPIPSKSWMPHSVTADITQEWKWKQKFCCNVIVTRFDGVSCSVNPSILVWTRLLTSANTLTMMQKTNWLPSLKEEESPLWWEESIASWCVLSLFGSSLLWLWFGGKEWVFHYWKFVTMDELEEATPPTALLNF